jgi:pimeloyl-ACP methyl ester carboxylesterase
MIAEEAVDIPLNQKSRLRRKEITPKVNQTFKLPDGRILGYDDHGPPNGKPVFFFHGTPGTRLNWYLFGSEELTQKLNIRIISLDRPGLGLSDFHAGRQFCDWPGDVISLADALDFVRFAVLGYSGGGPYAAACALHIPERLTSVGIVSGVGPHNVPGSTDDIAPENLRFTHLARDKPWLSRLAYRFGGVMARYMPGRLITKAMTVLPEPDRAVFAKPEMQEVFISMLKESMRSGARGAHWDTALMVSPWDFQLQDIAMKVYLWYGERDRNVSLAMGRYLAETLPNSDARFYPSEGHFSLIVNHVEEILRVLVT